MFSFLKLYTVIFCSLNTDHETLTMQTVWTAVANFPVKYGIVPHLATKPV